MAIKYMDVYRRPKGDISSGRYRPGDFLPTEPQLMAEYGVSRTTIRKAIALLREDGFIDARQGRSTEVRAAPRREDSYNFTSLVGRPTIESRVVHATDAKVVAQAATVETVLAPERVSSALGLDRGASVHLVQRLKIIGDEPVAHIASYLEASAFPDLVRHSGQLYYLYEFLSTHYGARFRRSQSRLTAVAADFVESRILDVPVGTPLVLHTRVTESDAGPLEYAESFERPDRLATFVTIAPEDEGAFLSYDA
ncbi:MAG: hypothetical protein CMH35_03600 [Microbacterium sp.]|nr:hypothetical protein [Microbacterium sp.]